jgi:hypothetical protein
MWPDDGVEGLEAVIAGRLGGDWVMLKPVVAVATTAIRRLRSSSLLLFPELCIC